MGDGCGIEDVSFSDFDADFSKAGEVIASSDGGIDIVDGLLNR